MAQHAAAEHGLPCRTQHATQPVVLRACAGAVRPFKVCARRLRPAGAACRGGAWAPVVHSSTLATRAPPRPDLPRSPCRAMPAATTPRCSGDTTIQTTTTLGLWRRTRIRTTAPRRRPRRTPDAPSLRDGASWQRGPRDHVRPATTCRGRRRCAPGDPPRRPMAPLASRSLIGEGATDYPFRPLDLCTPEHGPALSVIFLRNHPEWALFCWQITAKGPGSNPSAI